MRQFLIIFIMLYAGQAISDSPTEQEVMAAIEKWVFFEILPAEDGSVRECRFSRSVDATTQEPDPEFRPSQNFISEACRKLSKSSSWEVSRADDGSISKVNDYCMWSKAIPDSPICRAELGDWTFAEDIPRGVGYSAVLQLNVDEAGNITECSGAGVFELTPEAPSTELQLSKEYREDACRKLSTRPWRPGKSYYPCRFLPAFPNTAYCDRRFGQ